MSWGVTNDDQNKTNADKIKLDTIIIPEKWLQLQKTYFPLKLPSQDSLFPLGIKNQKQWVRL